MSAYITIVSGFLGSGKTTFLKKILPHITGNVALIENEFGDIGIDGDLLDNKFPIKEIYAGCICCSVANDLKKALEELVVEYEPDHILIEPSGVGSLSDILKICGHICKNDDFDLEINQLITIVDAGAFYDCLEVFGSFYMDQIQNAHFIFLSHTEKLSSDEIAKVVSSIKIINSAAFIVEDDWRFSSGESLMARLNTSKNYSFNDFTSAASMPANEFFSTFSIPKPRRFSEKDISDILASLNEKELGFISRAKGILKLDSHEFIHFDFTPQDYSWKYLEGSYQPKVVFIGSQLNKDKLSEIFSSVKLKSLI